jgi:hypothetical protein
LGAASDPSNRPLLPGDGFLDIDVSLRRLKFLELRSLSAAEVAVPLRFDGYLVKIRAPV